MPYSGILHVLVKLIFPISIHLFPFAGTNHFIPAYGLGWPLTLKIYSCLYWEIYTQAKGVFHSNTICVSIRALVLSVYGWKVTNLFWLVSVAHFSYSTLTITFSKGIWQSCHKHLEKYEVWFSYESIALCSNLLLAHSCQTVGRFNRRGSRTNFVGKVSVPLLCIGDLDDSVRAREAIYGVNAGTKLIQLEASSLS